MDTMPGQGGREADRRSVQEQKRAEQASKELIADCIVLLPTS